MVHWFHAGQSVLLRYDSGTKRRPGKCKIVVVYSEVKSQAIRDSEVQAVIKRVVKFVIKSKP